MRNFQKDYYKILNIAPFATADEVKAAYRKQVKNFHPDKHPNELKYEELIKEINEANEVLSDKDEKYAYDEYLKDKAAKQKEDTSLNKRTYTKKETVNINHFIYLKGVINIKYRGLPEDSFSGKNLYETFYNIKPTKLNALINDKDMSIQKDMPMEFLNVFQNKSFFKLKTPKLVECSIKTIDGIEYYQLEILDITLPKINITNVTKHENESYGELYGDFYGIAKKVETKEIEKEVTECFGETGQKEEKIENGIQHFRKQYYHTDCSTYWGNWVADIPKVTNHQTSRTERKGDYVRHEYFLSDLKSKTWGPWIFQRTPQLVGMGCLAYIFNGIGLLFYLFLFLSLFRGIGSGNVANVENNDKPKVVKKSENKPRVVSNSNKNTRDTFLLHNLAWEDYDGRQYSGSFGVKKKDYIAANEFKNLIDISLNNANSYDKIIFNLKEHDKQGIKSLYILFDSLRAEKQLDKMAFAEMVVSFVQKIPYTLVLTKSCDPSLYNDNFTVNYLQSKDARCVGYQRFGINTPIEFLAFLEGDCDTRTLLLYTVLAHYEYDLVLLSSEQYGHSLLGINLPYTGKAYNYNNQRYVFWETTAPDLRPGYLPNEISNSNYWRISLKSL